MILRCDHDSIRISRSALPIPASSFTCSIVMSENVLVFISHLLHTLFLSVRQATKMSRPSWPE